MGPQTNFMSTLQQLTGVKCIPGGLDRGAAINARRELVGTFVIVGAIDKGDRSVLPLHRGQLEVRLWRLKVCKKTMSGTHRIRLAQWIGSYSMQLVPTCVSHRHTDVHETKCRRRLLHPRRDKWSGFFARPYTQRVIPRRQRAQHCGCTCLSGTTVNAEGEVSGGVSLGSHLRYGGFCTYRRYLQLDLNRLVHVPDKSCWHRVLSSVLIHRSDLQLVPASGKRPQHQLGILMVHPAVVVKFVLKVAEVSPTAFQLEQGIVVYRTSDELRINRRLHVEGTGDLVGLSACFRNNTQRV